MLFERIASTSGEVAAASGKKKKSGLIAQLLGQVSADERAIAARYLSGEVGYTLGLGHASVGESSVQLGAASEANLSICEVDACLAEIAALKGSGSGSGRKLEFGRLLQRATLIERQFLFGLVLGELRQGALEALVIDAIAQVKALKPSDVRHAYMLAGEIGTVAEAVLAHGAEALARFGLTVFQPVLPMLAQSANDVAGALAQVSGPAVLEHKLDGFRVQIHKVDDTVRVYSRALNELTQSVPEIVALAAAFPAKKLILDGEAMALNFEGRPQPFQDTMKLLSKNRTTSGLSLTVFDVLLLDERTLLTVPLRERLSALDALVPAHRASRLATDDVAEATAFYEAALAAGHEGVMVKALDSPYEAGNRGAAWLKVKRVRRLDLVVLAAEWGSGRRKGTLSNLHLGARNPLGGFVTVSKTFKGMTDEVLAWQTTQLLGLQVAREGHIVHVKPELVVEIAFNDVLISSQYEGGFALRHARLVRYRPDKTAAEADTIDALRRIAEGTA